MMPLDVAAPPEVVALVSRCAPQVHPTTMLSLVKVESAFQPFLIGVNTSPRRSISAASAAAAAFTARELIAKGSNIDMGYAQVNSANLARLKLTVEQVFDPCTNIRTGARILTENYVRLRPTVDTDQAALDAALSAYNTGKPVDGLANGYVSAVRQNYTVPSIADTGSKDAKATSLDTNAPIATAAVTVARVIFPAWDAYGSARAELQSDASEAPPPVGAPINGAEADRVMVFDAKN